MRNELADTIQIGCLVEVPFRNAVDYAIVTSLESTEIPENPKSIVRVVTKIPLISPYQIRTIFDCASYYFVHAHQILSLFLSKTLVRYLEKKDFVTLRKNETGLKSKTGLEHISFYHHTGDTSFFEIIQKHIEGNTVIIFPDDFSLDAFLQSYPIDLETTLIIPDKLTETKKYKAFSSVYNGEKNIII
jgi:primosomal protein N'